MSDEQTIGGLPPPPSELSEEQKAKIAELQAEIDEIWEKKGDYEIDDEAWRSMPIFMENVSDNDVEDNSSCAALANLAYDNLTPEEIAEDLKKRGNTNLTIALKPDQVNKANVARSAAHFYTEAISKKSSDRKLNCLLYANRAQAQIIMQNFGHGLEDSQRAIVLDPSYAKAYYRAAVCAMRISKFDIAEKFLTHATTGEFAENLVKTQSNSEQLDQLKKLVVELQERKVASAAKTKKVQRQARAGQAEKCNITRKLQSQGIKVAQKMEVSSEQWDQYGRVKPYFEKLEQSSSSSAAATTSNNKSEEEQAAAILAPNNELLHVPMLLLWDEVSQSDFLYDVPANACMHDVLAEVLPPPWNEALGEGQYSDPDNLLIYFKVDDGIKMPEHYSIDPTWELQEIFRSAAYVMPNLVPSMHILPKKCKLIEEQIKPIPLLDAIK